MVDFAPSDRTAHGAEPAAPLSAEKMAARDTALLILKRVEAATYDEDARSMARDIMGIVEQATTTALEALTAENARLTDERDELRIGMWEIAHGDPPANPQDAELALRLLGEDAGWYASHRRRVEVAHAAAKQGKREAAMQELADLGQAMQPDCYVDATKPTEAAR